VDVAQDDAAVRAVIAQGADLHVRRRGMDDRVGGGRLMFILIGKMLKPLATPLGVSYLLWIAGALLYWRWSRSWGRRSMVVGVLVLVFFSNLLVGDAMIGSL